MSLRFAALFAAFVPLTAIAQESRQRIVVERAGVFHTPDPGDETKRIEIPMSAGMRFDRVIVELSVKHGGWNASSEKKTNHAIFWLNRGSRWRGNVLGYVNVFGPARPRVKMANNLTQPPGTMLAVSSDWRAEPGKTYRFRYVYDGAKERVELTVCEADRVVVKLSQRATEKTIESNPHNDDAGPGFFIVFGHPADSTGPEVPTYGWEYMDLHVLFE
jgi:hypothetical protein